MATLAQLRAAKAWADRNPAYIKRRNANQPREVKVLSQLRWRARQRSVPCTLTVQDVKHLLEKTVVCPVLGLELKHAPLKRTDASPSIDRVKPDGGYTLENVAVISWRANKLKNNASLAELQAIVAWMKTQEQTNVTPRFR